MKLPGKFEEKLKKAMDAEAGKICPSEDLFLQINRKIESENMGVKNMNFKPIKKTRRILVACMLLLVFTTITCFAAAKIVSYTSHSTNDTFAEFPSEKEVKKEAGFLPKYVEEFTAGYKFYRGGVGESTANTEDGTEDMTVKTAHFTYKNGDSAVSLLVEAGILPGEKSEGENVKITSDTEGRYSGQMYKFLPADYVMTAQDKADEESGKYVFSYGSQEIEINHMQQISWEDNGMSYTLINSDDTVDKATLVNMAAEIMNK